MKKTAAIFGACLLLLGAFFLGRFTRSPESPAPAGDSPRQKLQLSFTADYGADAYLTQISPDQSQDTQVSCAGMHDVTIHLDGTAVSLDDALETGLVTPDALAAAARQDAAMGFCVERWSSELGLTVFTYHYGDFSLRYIYDVYETPVNGKVLIRDVLIYESRARPILYLWDPDSPNTYYLDREDWGLSLEPAAAAPTQITVNYTQRQSQEAGELTVEEYYLYPMDENQEDGASQGYLFASGDSFGLPISVQSDGSGQFTLDWAGERTLEPGEYGITLTVSDNYDPAQLHPLLKKYHDEQDYHIVFTVPE